MTATLCRALNHIDEWPVLRAAFLVACCLAGIAIGAAWGRVSIWVMP